MVGFLSINVPSSNAGYTDHVHLKNTSYCLNSPYRSNYGNVDVYVCDGNDSDQNWSFEGNLIRLKDTSYCLNALGRENNANVFLWSCNSSDADQQWEWSGSNLRLKGTNFCLNTPYRYNNGNVFLWSCSGSDGDQQWEKGSTPPGPCPSSGTYCGGSVGQNASNLYSCSGTGANPQLSQTCANGCQTNPPGTPDACIQGACPSGGLYCGGSVGQNPSNLYSCSTAGAIPQQSEVCANGCQTNPPGTPDACIQGACPGGGDYCGASVAQNSANLYHCTGAGAVPTVKEVCSNGCQINPVGTADVCKPTDFCQTVTWGGAGPYCNGNTLVTCASDKTTVISQTCASGCQVNPPGTPDSCATTNANFCQTVTWGGAGQYCNGSSLVTCSASKQVTGQIACSNGCQVNPSGTADACVGTNYCETVSWGGAGPYCNGNELVYCSGDKKVVANVSCAQGCQTNPPGIPDSCANSDPCQIIDWAGAGDYCYGSTLLTCNEDKTLAYSKPCTSGCHVSPPYEADYCNDAGFCNQVEWNGPGRYCDGSALVECSASKQVVNTSYCSISCQNTTAATSSLQTVSSVQAMSAPDTSIPCGWPSSSERTVGWGCLSAAPNDVGKEICPQGSASDSWCGSTTADVKGNHGFQAMDIAGSFDVFATHSGTGYRCVDTLTQQTTGPSFGVFVGVIGDNGYTTLYAHLAPDPATDYADLSNVPSGPCNESFQSTSHQSATFAVTKGQLLGRTALVGRTDITHLHYEIRTAESQQNRTCPASYVDESNSSCGGSGGASSYPTAQCTNDLCHAVAFAGAGSYCYGNTLLQCSASQTLIAGASCSNRCYSFASNYSACVGSPVVTPEASVQFPVKDWQEYKIEPGFSYGSGPVNEWKQCEPFDPNNPASKSVKNGGNKYHAAIDVIGKNARGTEEVALSNPSQVEQCLLGASGAEIVAFADGQVVSVRRTDKQGYMVTMKHSQLTYNGKTVYSLYLHLDPTNSVTAGLSGKTITKGSYVGNIGPKILTPEVTNPHLHFELRTFDYWSGGYAATNPSDHGYINPCRFIPEHGGKVPDNCLNATTLGGGGMNWGPISIDIPAGVLATDVNVSIQELLDIEEAPSPVGITVLGYQYDVTLLDWFGQPVSQLNDMVNLSFSYDKAQYPFMLGQPNIGSYNETAGQWDTLVSTIDTANAILTTQTNHFSTYAVLGKTSSLSPVSKIITIPPQEGVVDNMSYDKADIMEYTPATGGWLPVLDGSSFGLDANTNISSVATLSDSSMLFTFIDRTSVPGVGKVEPIDIVQFIPSSLGANTVGTFDLYFDGSDVDLNEGFEDITALSVQSDGSIVITVRDDFNAGGVTGGNNNLYQFIPTQLGEDTQGSWSVYLDALTAGVPAAPNAIEILADGSVLLSFYDTVTLPTVGLVEDIDIVRFVPIGGGAGTFEMYFDGSSVGLLRGYYDVSGFTTKSDGSLLLRLNRKYRTSIGYTQETKDLLVFTPSSIGTTTAGTFDIGLDGSDIGFIHGTTLDALAQLSNGNYLISFSSDVLLQAVGSVNRSDIVMFVPPRENDLTGHFEPYITSGTLGLNPSVHNIVAMSVGATGQLYLVVDGKLYIDGVITYLNDVLMFSPTTQSLSLFLHGSDVGIVGSDAMIDSLWVDEQTSDVYISVNKSVELNGMSLTDADVFVCNIFQPGIQTQCSLEQYMESDNAGFLNSSLRDVVLVP